MRYYSTNNRNKLVSLKEAVLKGLAPDQGLYMPERIEPLPASFWQNITTYSYQEMAFHVAKQLLGHALPDEDLQGMVMHTLSFDTPVVEVEKDVFSLELFHGPTLAFKDVGARFLSGLLGVFARKMNREVIILVATSGDTGSAVANGFLGVPGTRVVILFPSGKVSQIQEKQFTTLGQNTVALEVDGTFDDCQRLVKQAFSDAELTDQLFLSSANSINIGRLIPQTFYYFRAYQQLCSLGRPLQFCVPSGNFGNLTAGLLATRLGLPARPFIAATNLNDVVPRFLRGEAFAPRVSMSTVSNAMDVGNPSNFARMLDLYQRDDEAVRQAIWGATFDDAATLHAMRDVWQRTGYLLDPHGAVAYLGCRQYHDSRTMRVFLETAHPGKFKEVVERAVGQEIALPDRLKKFLGAAAHTVKMTNDYNALREYLKQLA